RIVVFSPHPDDDVISAGGIVAKLHQNGNALTIAYQTSGNIAVFDHEVLRYLDFVSRAATDFGWGDDRLRPFIAEIETAIARKAPGEFDGESVLRLKQRIREVEALSAIQTLGLRPDQGR